MIIRCSNCNTAFSVDDSKVKNKKFAFTCPKCVHENIIDNRKAQVAAESDHMSRREAIVNTQDISRGSDQRRQQQRFSDEITRDTDDSLEIPDVDMGKGALSEDAAAEREDEFQGNSISVNAGTASARDIEIPLDDLETSINLDDIDIDLGTDDKATESKDTSFDDSMLIQDELDLPVDERPIEDELVLDDETETSSAKQEKEPTLDIDDILLPDDSIESSSQTKPEELTEVQEDLLTVSDDASSDMVKGSQSEITSHTFTLDDDLVREDTKDTDKTGSEYSEENDTTIDLDTLDIDLEGDNELLKSARANKTQEFEESHTTEKKKDSSVSDDDLTLDLQSLDIELEESGSFKEGEKPDDIDLVAPIMLSEEAPKKAAQDDDLTLDLDSLDISLEETNEVKKGEIPDDDEKLTLQDAGLTLDELTVDEEAQIKESDDEEIKLTIDEIDPSLGADLEDLSAEEAAEEPGDDEEIKLTIDEIDPSLGADLEDLSAEEAAEEPGDDEEIKLTIDEIDPSLGADLENLSADEQLIELETEDEEIKLTIDEIDPSLSIDTIETEYAEDDTAGTKSDIPADEESILLDEIDELPEIDLDADIEETGIAVASAGTASAVTAAALKDRTGEMKEDLFEEDLIDIDLDEDVIYDEEDDIKSGFLDVSTKGSVNFSIDYSIKFSRLGALLRIIGLIFISLLPHFLVFLIYTVLSMILGFLNSIIILTRGDGLEDFSQIEENQIRYFLSINTFLIGVVEQYPIFAGRDNIDYPLQMKVTYPLHNSRILAGLRLSLLGILIALIPHIILMSLLSLAVPLMYLANAIAVLITGKMPSVLYDFFTRYYRYCARILLFIAGIVDVYPTFKFD